MDFLDQVYFDNDIRSYTGVAITIVIAFLLKRFISKYASSFIFKLGKKQWDPRDKNLLENLIVDPIERILLVSIIIVALGRLKFPTAFEFSIYHVSIKSIFAAIAVAIIIACIVSLVLRFMDFLALVVRHKSEASAAPGEHQLLFFFKDFIKVIVIIFGILLIFKFSLHLDIGNLLTGLSIVGAAMALAARESLENLIASFVIFFDKPFKTGDYIQMKDTTGTVEKIGLRSTRIRTVNKSLITVPNKQLVDNILDNFSARDLVRNEIKTQLLPYTSSENLENAIKGIQEILNKAAQVANYTVRLEEITNDRALISTVYFTKPEIPFDDLTFLKQELNIEIKKMQEEFNIQPAEASMVTLVKGAENI